MTEQSRMIDPQLRTELLSEVIGAKIGQGWKIETQDGYEVVLSKSPRLRSRKPKTVRISVDAYGNIDDDGFIVAALPPGLPKHEGLE